MGISSIKVASADPESAGLLTVSILSPANDSSFVSLLVNDSFPDVNFHLIYETNEVPSWVGYSVDGSSNVTVSTNDTIVEVTPQLDSYSLTLYANDTLGNWASPQTVHFSIARTLGTAPPSNPTPTPTLTPSSSPLHTPPENPNSHVSAAPSPSPASSAYTVNSPSQTDTSITLNWNGIGVSNLGQLSYYNLTYGASANGTYTTVGPIYGYKNTSYVVTGLNPNTTYYFTIQYVFGHISSNGYQYQTATSNTLEAKTTPITNYSDWIPYAIIGIILVAVGASAVYLKKRKIEL